MSEAPESESVFAELSSSSSSSSSPCSKGGIELPRKIESVRVCPSFLPFTFLLAFVSYQHSSEHTRARLHRLHTRHRSNNLLLPVRRRLRSERRPSLRACHCSTEQTKPSSFGVIISRPCHQLLSPSSPRTALVSVS